jgi:glycosyltransferase involved in cell wall biosynthesis
MAVGLRGVQDVQGGIERHAQHLYPRLVELGCDVEVVARSPYVGPALEPFRGVRIRSIWSPRKSGLEAGIHTLLAVCWAGISRPDLLHIHAVGPALLTPLARLLGLRVVITHHGPDYEREKWGALARCVLRLGEALGVRFAHERIAISHAIRSLMAQRYRANSVLIPNGIEPAERADDETALADFGLQPGKYVLQVSRFAREKRQGDSIRAFDEARLEGWKLVLVGAIDHDDRYTRELIALAARSPGTVLTGFQTGQRLNALYGNAGVFVLPSSHEGLSLSLLEALSFGLHVLASDIPANREVGLAPEHYFALGDCRELAGRLREAARSNGKAGSSETQGSSVVGRYDWDAIARETLTVYENACSATRLAL